MRVSAQAVTLVSAAAVGVDLNSLLRHLYISQLQDPAVLCQRAAKPYRGFLFETKVPSDKQDFVVRIKVIYWSSNHWDWGLFRVIVPPPNSYRDMLCYYDYE